MSEKDLAVGELVKIINGRWAGSVGIVTQPITAQQSGHVLLHKDGSIRGIDASLADVEPVDENCEGFAQLGYQLIMLGSHVIEQKLIVYHS